LGLPLAHQNDLGQFGADDVPIAGRFHRNGPAERVAVEQGHHDARHQAEGREVAEPLGLTLVDPADLDRLTHRHVGQGRAGQLGQRAIRGRDRIAMRIRHGVSERGGHALDQRVRDRVLEALGLGMYRVPAVAEKPDQIGLDQPMTTHHPQRRQPPRLGQLDTLVGDVLEQTKLRETLDHAADGRRRQLQQVGDVAGGGKTAFRAEPVDRLEIILDRAGERVGGCVHANL
jgi:hypothetical protein